ncbi:MAG TPA: ArsR family transcriptional regulator [Nocardioides bacterium]|uniref:arsenate reductase/protein-tyrosine-phosphatase family protein n=1 Tax=uncultured Nocardioides sp. TaxID=198441 RepID=UPI000EB926C2|nr:ArsR family transcriptional regulator [uncultured Nocardioides sp.]HCB05209.1 ArsR family transcriptional regulator [Nocardioides sp.]HRD59693.1 helix-turn-helix domain-containing protein [Nocardioides sp.]
MNADLIADRERRAGAFAALGEPARLAIVERLALSDALPSQLAHDLGIGSNLLAHHLKVLESAGLIQRQRSEGDRRRTYVQLVSEGLPVVAGTSLAAPQRVLFVCTANTARSQLAALLWAAMSDLPVASAGTHPADAVDAGAVAAARRHRLRLAKTTRPQHLDEVLRSGDLVVTVCDRAYEELASPAALHWSVPDPVPLGTVSAFEGVLRDLDSRVHGLAERLSEAS